MKVKPIPTSFKKNEIRVIRIGEKAINELMWEALMENKSEWFNVQDCAEDIVFLMQWDKSKNQLTYIAVQDGFLSKEGLFHFRKLRKCPITTDSLFAKRRYRQLRLR